MPELPEVETVKIGLRRLLVGRVANKVIHNWDKSFPNKRVDVDEYLIGATVLGVRRRAKVLMVDLSTEHSLLIHLKMTGQLVFVPSQKWEMGDRIIKIVKKSQITNSELQTSLNYSRWGAGHPNDSLIGNLPDKTTRVTITFKDGSKLFFNDQRKFGWMRLIPTAEIPNIDFMKKVGPEPLEDSFGTKDFIKRIMKRKNSNIKAALLDQTVIAGVGNIYADESLFSAGIHPASIVSSIPKNRLIKLFEELKTVLLLSIEKGGSTDRNYVNAEGRRGSYIDFAKVFRKDKLPCPICGREIIKTRVAGRGTHICTKCQRLYKRKNK